MHTLDPLHHPDTVRKLLYGLHRAGEAHRHMHEHIDSRPPGSREAAASIYMLHIDAVARAVERLLDAQDRLRREAVGGEMALWSAAVDEELKKLNIRVSP